MPDRPGGPARRRLVSIGGAIVAALVLVAIFGPLLAPYPPNEQLDPAAGAYRPPGTRLAAVALADGRWRLAERVERTAEGLIVERRGEQEVYRADQVLNLTSEGVADQRHFLLGSDRHGRDMLARMVSGARVSLTIALLTVLLTLVFGIAVGALAVWGGGWIDALVMRLVDGFLAFPKLFLMVALSALIRPSTSMLILLLAGLGWPTVSRFVRAELLTELGQDYAVAARAGGASRLRVLLRHLLPNSLTSVMAVSALMLGDVILAESTLSFLSLGLQPPQSSWGNLINDGRNVLVSAWWASVLPGLAIALAVIGFTLIGDGLRDVLDPRLNELGDRRGRRPA